MPKAKSLTEAASDKPKRKKVLKPGSIDGRPSTYNDTIGRLICERVATNPVGLDKLITLYDDMPDHATIKAWRYKHSNFSSWYLEAKSRQSQLLVEEIDDMIPSEIRYIVDERGNERIDPPSASLVIAKINNRKWTAARLAPKIYGDRQIIEQTTAENTELKEELARLRAQLAEKSKKDY